MAIEAVPFFTGRQLSSDGVTAIASNTVVASLTAAETAAKNRKWVLAAAEVAYLPRNFYRASVVVDASDATADSTVTDSTASATIREIPGGAQLELISSLAILGPEPISITAGTGGCIVIERSYI